MRKEGQRQDVMFLAVAVCTLVLAIAIMIGVRALSRRQKEKTAPSSVAQASASKQVAQPTPKDTKRNPFTPPNPSEQTPGAKGKPGEAKEKPEEAKLALVGISVYRGEPMAVIRRGGKRYFGRVGGTVGGYTVVVIGRDRVTLVKGEERVILPLRQPEAEGSEE